MPLDLGLGTGPRALAIEDLEAMAASAMRREASMAHRRMDERAQTMRREGWDEGHVAGVVDGERQMLALIDSKVGEKVRAQHKRGAEMLQKVGENPRGVTKDELERTLDSLVDTLAHLLTEHHRGFEDVPF